MADPSGQENALVILARSGNRDAFEELVRKTGRMVYVRAFLETADAHRAEDVVQETYLRAWRSLHSLSDVKTFRGWLCKIAHSVVLDAAKHDSRKKRDGGKSDSEPLLRLADAGPSPPQSAEMSEQRQRVLSVVRELPDEYRDVIALRYLAGADYETIGRQLAISNGSLRGLLSRGMKMLREKLEG